MYIIGTAGHVDHGKTTLVKALTGVDTDRLPEEKRRALTIELGFASYIDDEGQRIGVVDVPGHERFIRNMASGTWALDCALLTVAADDGWMCQSEDHLHILRGMGVQNVIVVVTKCDTGTEERRSEVASSALLHCKAVLGHEPPVVQVSAEMGNGLDILKRTIAQSLKAYHRKQSPTCLYIDRSFVLAGIGPVVTGSLRGGSLSVGNDLHLLPSGKRARIRSLQSFGSPTTTVKEGTRTAIGLQGVDKEDLEKGMCLTREPALFSTGKSAVAILESPILGQPLEMKNHITLDIAWGTSHDTCTIHHLAHGSDIQDRSFSLVRIICHGTPVWYWNQPFICMLPGGSTVVSYGRILSTDRLDKVQLKRMNGLFSVSSDLPSVITSQEHLRLAIRGYAHLPDEGSKSMKIGQHLHIAFDGWFIREELAQNLMAHIIELAKRGQGVPLETAKQGAYPPQLIASLIGHMVKDNQLSLDCGILRTRTGKAISISPAAEQLYRIIFDCGQTGYPVKQLQKEEKDLLGILLHAKQVVMVESTFVYPTVTYRKMIDLVLKDRSIGDLFSIADAKRYLSLSRKYMIPLLNRMEYDGLIERVGDQRKVLKTML